LFWYVDGVLSYAVSDGPNHEVRLSRAIDAAYERYKVTGDAATESHLYCSFLAQAENIVFYRRAPDPETLSRDITTRAICSIGGFRGDSSVSTWFWTLAQNEVTRALREIVNRRVRFKSLESGGKDGATMDIVAVPRNLDAPIDVQNLT
jgi:hypothetical protein